MSRLRVSLLGLVAGALLLAGCSTLSTEDTVVVTAASDVAPVRLPDFQSPSELEEAVLRFGACVEEYFPIVIRFRSDPYLGMSTEVSSQRIDEGDAVDQVTQQCMLRLDLDRRLSLFQESRPISEAIASQIVDEFVVCAAGVSPAMAAEVSKADLTNLTDVERFMFGLAPGGSQGFSSDELVAVSSCHADVTGPPHAFTDGHPWFEVDSLGY